MWIRIEIEDLKRERYENTDLLGKLFRGNAHYWPDVHIDQKENDRKHIKILSNWFVFNFCQNKLKKRNFKKKNQAFVNWLIDQLWSHKQSHNEPFSLKGSSETLRRKQTKPINYFLKEVFQNNSKETENDIQSVFITRMEVQSIPNDYSRKSFIPTQKREMEIN